MPSLSPSSGLIPISLDSPNTWTAVNSYTNQVRWAIGEDITTDGAELPGVIGGNYANVLIGTSDDITSFQSTGKAGTVIRLHFTGNIKLIHSDFIELPGTLDFEAKDDDELTFVEIELGKFNCTAYVLSTGGSVTGVDSVKASTTPSPNPIVISGTDKDVIVGLRTDQSITTFPSGDATYRIPKVEADTAPKLGGILTTNDHIVLLSKGADIATSASGTLTIGNDGNFFEVTGTDNITRLSDSGERGTEIVLQFTTSLVLELSSSLIIPGLTNITTQPVDIMKLVQYESVTQGDSGNLWRSVSYQRFDGTPIVGVTSISSTGNAIVVTDGATDTPVISVKTTGLIGNFLNEQGDYIVPPDEQGVESVTVTAGDNAIVIDNTDTANPTVGVTDGAGVGNYLDGEGNYTIPAGTGLQAVVDDPSPELGGILESNGHRINAGEIVVTAAAILPIDLAGVTSNTIFVDGSTTITSIAAAPLGTQLTLVFAGTPILVNTPGTLDLPGNANITVANRDSCTVLQTGGSANWVISNYQRGDGTPIVGGPVVDDPSPQLGGSLESDNGTTTHSIIFSKGANISTTAGGTITPGTDGNSFIVTGSDDITAIADSGFRGVDIDLRFPAGINLVDNNNNLILPTGETIITENGDTARFNQQSSQAKGDTNTIWECFYYSRFSGKALITNLSDDPAPSLSAPLETTLQQIRESEGTAINNTTGNELIIPADGNIFEAQSSDFIDKISFLGVAPVNPGTIFNLVFTGANSSFGIFHVDANEITFDGEIVLPVEPSIETPVELDWATTGNWTPNDSQVVIALVSGDITQTNEPTAVVDENYSEFDLTTVAGFLYKIEITFSIQSAGADFFIMDGVTILASVIGAVNGVNTLDFIATNTTLQLRWVNGNTTNGAFSRIFPPGVTQAARIPFITSEGDTAEFVNQTINGFDAFRCLSYLRATGEALSNEIFLDKTPTLGGILESSDAVDSQQIRQSQGAEIVVTGAETNLVIGGDGNYFSVNNDSSASLETFTWKDSNIPSNAGTVIKFIAASSFTLSQVTQAFGTLELPNGADISLSVGDVVEFVEENVGPIRVFRFTNIQRTSSLATLFDDKSPDLGGNLHASPFQINQSRGADINDNTVANELNIFAADGNTFHASVVNTFINSFGFDTAVSPQGTVLRIFCGTDIEWRQEVSANQSQIILPSGLTIFGKAGDLAEFIIESTTFVRLVSYLKFDGTGLVTKLENDTAPKLGGILNANSKQVRLNKGTTITAASAIITPDGTGNFYDVSIASAQAVDTVTLTGVTGTRISLHFTNDNINFNIGGNLDIPGGITTLSLKAGDVINLVEDGSIQRFESYSLESGKSINDEHGSGSVTNVIGGTNITVIDGTTTPTVSLDIDEPVETQGNQIRESQGTDILLDLGDTNIPITSTGNYFNLNSEDFVSIKTMSFTGDQPLEAGTRIVFHVDSNRVFAPVTNGLDPATWDLGKGSGAGFSGTLGVEVQLTNIDSSDQNFGDFTVNVNANEPNSIKIQTTPFGFNETDAGFSITDGSGPIQSILLGTDDIGILEFIPNQSTVVLRWKNITETISFISSIIVFSQNVPFSEMTLEAADSDPLTGELILPNDDDIIVGDGDVLEFVHEILPNSTKVFKLLDYVPSHSQVREKQGVGILLQSGDTNISISNDGNYFDIAALTPVDINTFTFDSPVPFRTGTEFTFNYDQDNTVSTIKHFFNSSQWTVGADARIDRFSSGMQLRNDSQTGPGTDNFATLEIDVLIGVLTTLNFTTNKIADTGLTNITMEVFDSVLRDTHTTTSIPESFELTITPDQSPILIKWDNAVPNYLTLSVISVAEINLLSTAPITFKQADTTPTAGQLLLPNGIDLTVIEDEVIEFVEESLSDGTRVFKCTNVSPSNLINDPTPTLGGVLETDSHQIRESQGSGILVQAGDTDISIPSGGNYFDINVIDDVTIETMTFDAPVPPKTGTRFSLNFDNLHTVSPISGFFNPASWFLFTVTSPFLGNIDDNIFLRNEGDTFGAAVEIIINVTTGVPTTLFITTIDDPSFDMSLITMEVFDSSPGASHTTTSFNESFELNITPDQDTIGLSWLNSSTSEDALSIISVANINIISVTKVTFQHSDPLTATAGQLILPNNVDITAIGDEVVDFVEEELSGGTRVFKLVSANFNSGWNLIDEVEANSVTNVDFVDSFDVDRFTYYVMTIEHFDVQTVGVDLEVLYGAGTVFDTSNQYRFWVAGGDPFGSSDITTRNASPTGAVILNRDGFSSSGAGSHWIMYIAMQDVGRLDLHWTGDTNADGVQGECVWGMGRSQITNARSMRFTASSGLIDFGLFRLYGLR